MAEEYVYIFLQKSLSCWFACPFSAYKKHTKVKKGDYQQGGCETVNCPRRNPIPVKDATNENAEKEYSHFNKKYDSQRIKHDPSANSDTTAPLNITSCTEVFQNIK